MKSIIRLSLVAALLCSVAARADNLGLDMSGVSPASAGATVTGASPPVQIGMFTSCAVYVGATGATGGTLDIFVQTLFKQSNVLPGFWMDVAHLPQIAAAAPLTGYTFTLTRWSSSAAAVFTPVNTASATPILAVNTVVNGVLGYQLRIVYKTGAGTTVGATQTILATCSDT